MTRFAKTNRQGQSKSAPLADTVTGYKATFCPTTDRLPTRLTRTASGLTQIGDVLVGAMGLPARTAPYRMGGYRRTAQSPQTGSGERKDTGN